MHKARFRILFIFGVVYCSTLSVLRAQNVPIVPSKAKKLYEKAEAAIDASALDKASKYLEAALEVAPDFFDAIARLAGVQYDLGNTAQALVLYKQALQLNPGARAIVWYQTALVCVKLMRFEEAATYLETYLARNPKNELQKKQAEALLAQSRFSAIATRNPVPFNPYVLGKGVNTDNPEYLPALSADASLLVFTRVVDGQEDFFSSVWNDSTGWQTAQPILELNTRFNEGAHCLSADGRTLIFTACNYPDGLGSCDLYVSHQENGRWSTPVNLGAPVNSAGYETQPSLSADGNILFFASSRPGGKGKIDLWQSIRSQNGKWGMPQNVGASINTPEDDQAPFLHPDGQTLYFMSKGHPGMGNFDLFVARRDTSGQWQTPLNLGYPINTAAHEGALTVRADGRVAYFTKSPTPGDRGLPQTDIYSFELYPEARPLPVTYVKGVIRDAVSGQPLQGNVEIQVAGIGQPLLRVQSGTDGVFLACLPLGKEYALYVQQTGYLFYSDHFNLSGRLDSLPTYFLELHLQPIVVDDAKPGLPTVSAPVVLRNVFFDVGSAALLPASRSELMRLYELLQEHQSIRIQIQGHTDDTGDSTANQLLSERRAKAVHDFLVEQGISATRLSYKGFGATMPLVPNTSPENRQMNRRTEFVRVE